MRRFALAAPGKREYAHWESERGKQGDGKVNDGSFDDSVLPIVEAGKAVMIDSDHQPDPLLTIKDYPGHTPGSIAINLKDGGRQACFSGDIMHHPIQVYHPDWSSQFCSDKALASRTRIDLFETAIDTASLVIPAHLRSAWAIAAVDLGIRTRRKQRGHRGRRPRHSTCGA